MKNFLWLLVARLLHPLLLPHVTCPSPSVALYCIHIVYSFFFFFLCLCVFAGHLDSHSYMQKHAYVLQACIAFRCCSRGNCFIKCCYRIQVVGVECGRGHRRDHLAPNFTYIFLPIPADFFSLLILAVVCCLTCF